MIIVNQDKDAIINLNNTNEIRATKTGKILLFDNTYRSQDDCSDVLGKYKTEERAKEVLEKIYKVYSDFTLIKNTRDKIQRDLIIGEQSKYFDVFEMPED